MRILITGNGGMLGMALRSALKDHELILPKTYQLNVANVEQVMRYKADFIIHLAAETDHEYCEANPSNCYYVNTIGTANMVKLAKSLDVPIIYLSAASVFDGKKREPYIYFDEPNPVNHYNSSKYYAELIVQSYKKHYIIRTGWLFGGGAELDKKFVNKILTKIKDGAKTIKVCDDCIGSPTYSVDLARTINWVATLGIDFGKYHVVNYGVPVSRHDIAAEIIKAIKMEGLVTIEPCKIDDLKEEFPCKRTNYEGLQSSFTLRHWKEALHEYLAR